MTVCESKGPDFGQPEEIAGRQLILLQRHLSYLQQFSPFYKELFRRHHFSPEDFRSLADLAKLPLVGKADLTEHNRDFLAVSEDEIVDICQTSGTTGNPVTLWQTEGDLQRLARNEQLAFSIAAIKKSDRVLIGAALDRVFMAGLAYFLGLREIGATAIRAGSGQPALVAELIRTATAECAGRGAESAFGSGAFFCTKWAESWRTWSRETDLYRRTGSG